MNAVKIAVIGAGSSYTPELADGILKRFSTFPVKELALVDIDSGMHKAGIIASLTERMFKKAGLSVAITCTTDRREALKGCNFVVSQFRVGGLQARSNDEKIPMKYGMVGQETTGPGGFTKALRTIPVILDICRDIEEICPDAWLINFTNPSGIITEAVHTYTKVKCIGLCNVPINMTREVCNFLHMEPERVHCRFAGLNHLSFIGRIYVDGTDIVSHLDLSALTKGSVVKNIPGTEIPAELLQVMGFIPSPYLKYYYLEKQMLEEQREKLEKEHKTRADEVMEVERALFEKYADPALAEKPAELSKRGGALYSEAAVSLMDSIWNDRSDIHVVNTVNNGCLPELPDGAVIETNCIVNREGATPLTYGPLPGTIRGLVQQVKAYEQLTIQAAAEGSPQKALAALINNPLVHDAAAAKELLGDLLAANREYLPGFFRGGDTA